MWRRMERFAGPVMVVELMAVVMAMMAPSASAFNLDAEKALVKEGPQGSLFGLSVAMHQKLENKGFASVFLAGAPRSKADTKQTSHNTGALFSCPFTPDPSDCERVNFDISEFVDRESKEDEWMGVSVASQRAGGMVITCAHRYENRAYVGQPDQEQRHLVGRCFLLTDLLVPADELFYSSFCKNRDIRPDGFGMCQQGTAAGFVPDSDYIYYGAPGTYNWKGIVRVEQWNKTLAKDAIYLDPQETGDEKKMNQELIPLAFHSYLGYSLDGSRGVTNRVNVSFLAGAPRANHTGAALLLKASGQAVLIPELLITGQQLGSGFGYDVALADLNGDRWMEVLVSAPNYFSRRDEAGGAVYVYRNRQGNVVLEKPTVLTGPPYSAFGTAVARAGDLNQDGFQDIAIGAPFAGSGKVYIYHGGKGGIATEPAQVISGQELKPPITQFGFSLSGDMDVDDNTYPDLLVGSMSDKIAVLRSRPIVRVTHNITVSPELLDASEKNCGSYTCIKVSLCFTYVAKPASYSPRLVLNFTVEAEVERRRLGMAPRVSFVRGAREAEVQRGTVVLNGQSSPKCSGDVVLQINENIRDKLRPIVVVAQYGIQETRAARRGNRQEPGDVATLDSRPVLDPTQLTREKLEVNFLKEGCGSDGKCHSNLQLRPYFCSEVKEGDCTLLPTDETGAQVLSLRSQKDVTLGMDISNEPSNPARPDLDGHDAHDAHLSILIPSAITYTGFRNADRAVSCTPLNDSATECELGNPFNKGQRTKLFILLGTLLITTETTEFAVELRLSTASDQQTLQPIVARLLVRVEIQLSITGLVKPSQVTFGGRVQGESAMNAEEDVGSLVEYTFAVSNLGKPLLADNEDGTVLVSVSVPSSTESGKWLLYLMSVHTALGAQPPVPCQPAGVAVNELNLLQSSLGGARRRRRGAEEEREGGGGRKTALVIGGGKKPSATFDCVTSRCLNLLCPLDGLTGAGTVTLRTRVWNSTFLEDYIKYENMELFVTAGIIFRAKNPNVKMPDVTPIRVRLTLDPDGTVTPAAPVPWWVIALSVAAGVFVLLLLVVLLWKCGFFKRPSPYAHMPKYQAVRIRKEERQRGVARPDRPAPRRGPRARRWVTTWSDRYANC
ncbi:integrin alpha-6-like isoform X1 [Petromyzon marinus]|uniref:integrin alpha-6-like isoform X1 n=2 Tax=Petromyzon marinus TaxID=7757 RepID=UPI003F6EF7FA